jgi:hypothetical protein
MSKFIRPKLKRLNSESERLKQLRSKTFTISLKQDITKEIEKFEKYAWIYHDKDEHPVTGKVVKPHYHIYLEFVNARYLTALARRLGIIPNLIEVVEDKKRLLDYLTHKNDPQKHKYSVDEIHTNFEIKVIEESLNVMVVYRLLSECSSMPVFLLELKQRGLKGNPVTVLNSCFSLWQKKRGDNV